MRTVARSIPPLSLRVASGSFSSICGGVGVRLDRGRFNVANEGLVEPAALRKRAKRQRLPETFRTLLELPLFSDDLAIGAALLGPARAREFIQIARLLEHKGLPKPDPIMGGRNVRAVILWFDVRAGLADPNASPAPDGKEAPWDATKRRTRSDPR